MKLSETSEIPQMSGLDDAILRQVEEHSRSGASDEIPTIRMASDPIKNPGPALLAAYAKNGSDASDEGEGPSLAPPIKANFMEVPDDVMPEPKEMRVCSYNVCPNGHKWNPAINLTHCPGCNSPVLAVRMEQCPICNEPTEQFALRSDHMNERGMIISPLCKKPGTMAEVTQIVMQRNHATQVEAKQ